MRRILYGLYRVQSDGAWILLPSAVHIFLLRRDIPCNSFAIRIFVHKKGFYAVSNVMDYRDVLKFPHSSLPHTTMNVALWLVVILLIKMIIPRVRDTISLVLLVWQSYQKEGSCGTF